MNKLEGLIGIARKAGFVIVDKTAGASLKRQMGYVANDRQIPLYEIENLGTIVGISSCKAIGLKNKALSEQIEGCLKGE